MVLGGGGVGLSPPNQKYSPLNEMKPIRPFGLGLMFYARFVSKKLMDYRTQNDGIKIDAQILFFD